MQIRHRRATPADLALCSAAIERDRPLFSARTWNKLPALLEDLLLRERILLCPLLDVESGRMVGMGGSGFLDPEFLQEALATARGFVDFVLGAELDGVAAFLNRQQVAAANRAGDLRLLNFFGAPEIIDYKDPAGLEILGHFTDTWNFYHKGFALREIYYECTLPLMIETGVRIGMRVHQERTLASGARSKLFVYDLNDAVRLTPSWPASAMITPRPRFGFSRAEQQLLELALLDHSDHEAAAMLQLSAEAIKKRWRSIYGKISRVEPNVLRRELNGSGQRRALLQSLRNSLQELRPY